jgi:hypothetical protein
LVVNLLEAYRFYYRFAPPSDRGFGRLSATK